MPLTLAGPVDREEIGEVVPRGSRAMDRADGLAAGLRRIGIAPGNSASTQAS